MPERNQHLWTVSSHRPRLRRTGAVLGGAAAAAAVWVITGPVAGADLTVRTAAGSARQHVGVGSVIVVALVAGLAGWALLAALELTTRHPRRAWTISAILVLLASLAGPVGAHAHADTVAALIAMHMVVAASLIWLLGRTAAPSQRAASWPPGVRPGAMPRA